MHILTINAGSSSIKYEWFNITDMKSLCSGVLERIGEPGTILRHCWLDGDKSQERQISEPIPDHLAGMQLIQKVLHYSLAPSLQEQLRGIGHRVVHGGAFFAQPTLLDKEILARIRELSPLAPLHNPANVIGIEACLRLFPDIPQVAVFDTAFHQDMPEHAYLYPLPQKLNVDYHIRRYGFHGTSHAYVCDQAAHYLQKPPAATHFISLHLGNGASVAAVRGGHSIDTSMGMTPLEGLMMGTRCGDIDAGILFYLHNTVGLGISDIDALLNHESGLKGIAGINDMRELLAKAPDNSRAQLAVTMFCYRVKKYIGAYAAALGKLDSVIFTGGIGENAAAIRQQCCANMDILGIHIDLEKNARDDGAPIRSIHSEQSRVAILVIRTDEELEIARQSADVLSD